MFECLNELGGIEFLASLCKVHGQSGGSMLQILHDL